MTRREWLASASVTAALAQAPARPNIVFILADDLGYGDLGCYGQEKIATPHLDALAASGVRFTSAYAGASVCAPSRCSLMTGLHTGHTRIRGNGKNETVLRAEDRTVAELLRASGYRTGIFGKWGLGQLGYPGYPTKKGWEEWVGYFSQTHAHNYYPEMLHHNDGFFELMGNTGTRRRDYAPDVIHGYALRWLEARKAEEPFFLYYNSTIPHTNNEMGRDTGNGQEVPEDAPYSAKPWPQVEKNFAAMVSRLDRLVGSLVTKLKERGLYENTLILFASDNGAHKEGGHDPAFFHSSGPLRGTKRDLYEGGIRVPAFAVWDKKIAPGGVSDAPWAFWDVLPTFCEAAGILPPTALDGRSVLGQWRGRAAEAHRPFYWEFHEGGFTRAVRKAEWKAIQLKTGKVELYDLSKDLSERVDLAASDPAGVLKELRELLVSSRVESADWPTQA